MKATIPQNAEVYQSANDKPSEGDFRSDVKQIMLDIVKFFHDNDLPFTVNIYPFLSLYLNQHFPVEYAFFDGNGQTIPDNGKNYDNVFDANYDTLVYALNKAGIKDMKIIVGWPTDGHKYATPKLAEKFYAGLMKKLAKDVGTPLRPEKLEVYLFGLLDEDMKSILPGPFERHWGIFRYDGTPKFMLDFTGQGRKIVPVAAKDEVGPDLDYACYHGDCTAMLYGSTCSNLDKIQNISYAFNMFFQIQGQDVRACDFRGSAMITKNNASVGSCLFPIQIVSGSGDFRISYVFGRFIVAGLILLGLVTFCYFTISMFYYSTHHIIIITNTINLDEVGPDLDYACYHGDCTAMLYGSTCSNLDKIQNISYAFNMFFQIQGQDVRACDFRGSAMITKNNASVGSCLFPIQIVSGSGDFRISYVFGRFIVAGLILLGLVTAI
ncbi:hypothetical protein F2Q69_00040172 [Brassica cretica]|uniref:glucan endo-1,3-beta-D-glucosidase n=1 Tax=Brassica cretica TaxID=69181 RepID=A0A8S9N6I8_BRACR|nr:hypothetical protein F2Q69_00040172 [Brassica cretica]